MKSILLIFILLSCSGPHKKGKRFPSSILLSNESHNAKIKLFAGTGMPKELVIAKSLPGAPLEVEILNPPPEVHCKDSIHGKESTLYRLPSNKKGIYAHISCRLDSKGLEHPEMVTLTVKYTVILDEFEISDDEYKTKEQLISYLDILDKGLPWSQEMKSFIEGQLPLVSRSLSANDPKVQTILTVDDSDSIYISIKSFSGSFTDKGFLGRKKMDVKGHKKHSKAMYSKYNEKSLVCGFGVDNGKISEVLLGEGELGEKIGSKQSFNCQFNFRSNENVKKNKGSISIFYKGSTFKAIRKILQTSIENEEDQIKGRIKSYHHEEYQKMHSNINEISKIMNDWSKKRDDIIKQIERDKFVAFKDKTIAKLFPDVVKGQTARSANKITISPVRKIIYNESGEQKNILYLNIKNSISYKIETPEFNAKLDRDLPFEEQVNLYLATSEVFGDQKVKTITVCNDKIDNFYRILGGLQDEMNTTPPSYSKILNSFKPIDVDSVTSCPLGDIEKTEVAYSRGRGETDFLIQWSRRIVGKKEVLKATKVGEVYYADILGSSLSYDLYRDKKYSHPAFKKGFSLTIDKGSKESSWVEEEKAYIDRYNEEDFIKVAY